MTDYYITINLDKREPDGKPTVTHTQDTTERPPVTIHIELIENGATLELGSVKLMGTREDVDFRKFGIDK